MKKIWLLILSLALIGTAVYFANKYLFYQFSLTRGIVPAINLPGKDIKQYLPQSSQLDFPLKIRRGFTIDIFSKLDGNLPRALSIDPGGNLLVSVTNKGKVLALPDSDKDGKADKIVEVISGLNKPHGIAFDRDMIYIAETDQVVRYSYNSSDFTLGVPEILFELPAGGRHFTRTIKVHNGKLYTSVGSSCDVCNESDWRRASILVSELDGTDLKTFAKGLRNSVFFNFDSSGNLWATEMGRDNLGDNLPPDELNIIEEGQDYGWPYCYGKGIRDSKFKPGEEANYCADTQAPAFEFPAHVAPLGLAFIDSENFPPSESGSLLVSYHGSWNSSIPVGYKIASLSVYANTISAVDDYISGWLQNGDSLGRPVDLVFDDAGELYVSDDKAGVVYIISRNK